MKRQSPTTPPPARRRPQQSRARQTSQALQEAFVRLLPERGYAALTIREIVEVAGTGLGSFYEYFTNKDDLARVSIHLRSKALLLAMRGAIALRAQGTVDDMVDGIIDALAEAHRGQPAEWGAHYMLERQISDARAYCTMYERFVKEWMSALASTSSGWAAHPLLPDTARTCHAIAYGQFSHVHIRAHAESAKNVKLDATAHQARLALHAYLQQVGGSGTVKSA